MIESNELYIDQIMKAYWNLNHFSNQNKSNPLFFKHKKIEAILFDINITKRLLHQNSLVKALEKINMILLEFSSLKYDAYQTSLIDSAQKDLWEVQQKIKKKLEITLE